MVKLVELSCPSCGASIQVGADRKECFCSFCGAKAILDDGSVTTHIIDEAKIREAEANEKIKLKEAELELERLNNLKEKETMKMAIILNACIWGVLIILVAILAIAGVFN